MRRLPILLIGAVLALCSCGDEKKSYVTNVGDGESTPTMSTVDVNTFISDSGYTRYFITAPIWNIYDEARDPLWRFPEGLELEQYDRSLRVAATMRCDSAKYLSQRRIWQLDGNVVMVNTQRDSFLTQQVFWNQINRKIYSDSFIHIVRADRIIEGYGFISNEQMSAYSVNRPTGIFPIELADQQATADTATVPDSLSAPAMRRRRAAPPRASRRADTTAASIGLQPLQTNTNNH